MKDVCPRVASKSSFTFCCAECGQEDCKKRCLNSPCRCGQAFSDGEKAKSYQDHTKCYKMKPIVKKPVPHQPTDYSKSDERFDHWRWGR